MEWFVLEKFPKVSLLCTPSQNTFQINREGPCTLIGEHTVHSKDMYGRMNSSDLSRRRTKREMISIWGPVYLTYFELAAIYILKTREKAGVLRLALQSSRVGSSNRLDIWLGHLADNASAAKTCLVLSEQIVVNCAFKDACLLFPQLLEAHNFFICCCTEQPLLKHSPLIAKGG